MLKVGTVCLVVWSPELTGDPNHRVGRCVTITGQRRLSPDGRVWGYDTDLVALRETCLRPIAPPASDLRESEDVREPAKAGT